MVVTTAPRQALGTQPAIAIRPLEPESLHLTEIPRGEPGPGQARVRILQVGVCGTDRELIAAHFGRAPAGENALVLGHEMLGRVEEVGPGVGDLQAGEFVSATVRRPDGCPSCQAGQPDMCQWMEYRERGIAGLHGFMTEEIIEDVQWLVAVPPELTHIGILLEPLSVVEKALRQATLIQRRIAAWNPKTALVIGTGPIGLLGMMLLRARGMDVVSIGNRPSPQPALGIIETAGARYVSLQEQDLKAIAAGSPPIDLVFEASGRSAPAFAAMEVLGNNGVLILLSGTGGNAELTIPADTINRALLGGNKIVAGCVNSVREDFEAGVEDLRRFEQLWPGLAERLITRRLDGLGAYAQILEKPAGDVKTIITVG